MSQQQAHEVIRYKWYLVLGCALIGTGFGYMLGSAFGGLIFGFGFGILMMILFVAIIKFNY
jgi:hypothetical protein